MLIPPFQATQSSPHFQYAEQGFHFYATRLSIRGTIFAGEAALPLIRPMRGGAAQ
jgi:hypothetical protein